MEKIRPWFIMLKEMNRYLLLTALTFISIFLYVVFRKLIQTFGVMNLMLYVAFAIILLDRIQTNRKKRKAEKNS